MQIVGICGHGQVIISGSGGYRLNTYMTIFGCSVPINFQTLSIRESRVHSTPTGYLIQLMHSKLVSFSSCTLDCNGNSYVALFAQTTQTKLSYRLFLEGQTPYGIKRILEADGIPSPAGKKTWQAGTILSILTNEKYKGDALLQKTFCTDFLTKKMKINEGEVPQYYVENSHPAIISAELFEMVQEELARRKQMGHQHNGTSCFAGTIFCECCGGMYGSKVWHSNTKYRRVVWQCNGKYKKGEPVCATPNLTDTVIQEKFLEAFNRLLSQREFIQQDIKAIIAFLTDTKVLRAEAAELHNEMDIVTALMKQAIEQNASMALNQDEYAQRYRALAERYQKAELRFKSIEDECAKRTSKRRSMTAFASRLMESDEKITEFTPTLWNAMVEKVLVEANGTLRFIFRNDTEISV